MTDPISEYLEVVRARLRRRQTLGGAASGLALLFGITLALLVAAGALGPGPLWLPLAAAAAGALGLGGVALALRAKREWATDERVARFVGGRLADVGDALLSAVELHRERAQLEPVASVQLLDAHRARVAARLKAVEPARLVDFVPERKRSALRLGAVALGWLVALVLAPGVIHRGWDGLRHPRPDQVATSAEPILGDLQIRLDYPAYTGLPPRVIPASSGQVVALPGTEVTLEARALVPVRAAKLVFDEDGAAPSTPPEVTPVEVRAGGLLATRFRARKPGRYRFVFEGGARAVREPDTHRVDIEPDRPPRVDLYAPAEDLEVAGTRRVEIGWSSDDDYGLGDLELVFKSGQGPETRRVITKALKPASPAPLSQAPPARSSAGKYEWDLAELDLKPGARVAYHLEAKDNDTVSGPNVGSSRTFYLSIFSPREKQEQALASEEQLLEQAITLLADRLEVRRGEDAALVDTYSRIHNRAEALLLALARATRAALAQAKAGEPARKLHEMHARLAKLTADEEQLLAELRRRRPAGRHAPARSPAPGRPEAGNLGHVAELERDVITLDDLLGRQRLEALLAVGDEMSHARDRLRSLLQKYKQTRSDELRREIERELKELERKLAELRARAAKLASELPDQFLNADAMGKNDLGDRLDQIRKQMERGDVEGAMAELEKLSSSLDGMVASMEQDLRGFRRERFSAEEKAMAELEDQLSELAHDEGQIKADTEAVKRRMQAEAQRLLRDKIEPLARRARDKVAQLKKQVESVDPGVVPPYDLEELARVKQRVDDLARLLQSGDFDEARHAANEADHELASLGADLRDEEARMARGGDPGAPRTRSARERTDQAEKLARQVAEELDRAMPQPGQLMAPDDFQRMGQLGQRQEAARRRAQELGKGLKSKTGEGGRPLALPPGLEEGLHDAGEHMERATGELRRREARGAEGEESQALEKLAKMQEQLQRERRPREQSGGGRLDRETVKIPGADEYRAPKEFRQDLLEAMKRGAPADYKDQVKRYYEELVK